VFKVGACARVFRTNDARLLLERTAVEKLEKPLSKRFDRALRFASRLHANQPRKGTQIPYFAHLMAVASIAMEAGANEDEAIAALLHDAPEDQGGKKTLNKIRRRFGSRVAAIVEHCSDTFETPKPPWLDRKRIYVDGLKSADAGMLLVSIADKVHNAQATLRDLRIVGPEVFDRFSASPAQTMQNYRNLLAAYESGPADDRRESLVAELRRTLDSIDAIISQPPKSSGATVTLA